MNTSRQVIVALSGGVDSAVAALLLQRQGWRVEGLHMTNWEDPDGYCTAGEDHAAAQLVARELGIPLHHVRFGDEYRERVFRDFLQQYAAGRTPNPDIACNRHIKFGVLLEHALRLGAGYLATGHYARIEHEPAPRLLLARDAAKDQTYFLHAVGARALAHVLFPLGDLMKPEVRRTAAEAGLPNHARGDSTGICFIGERPFGDFLARYLPEQPGPILDLAGRELGRHRGLAWYTPGQRQGLGIGGLAGHGEAPWYVAAKDTRRNALIVVQDSQHPLLMARAVRCTGAHWIDTTPPGLSRGIECRARIRHRGALVRCTALPYGERGLEVRFRQPVRAAAAGQSVVLYAGETCLGGGEIDEVETLQQPAARPSGACDTAADPL